MFRIDDLKRKIRERGYVCGTHVKWSYGNLVDLFSLMGYDYIWLDGEHGTMSLDDVNNNIRIAQGNGAAAFYRVAWNDPVRVKPILEMAPDGIVFPYIRTAEEARMAVAACKYPPKGIRGYAPARAMHYGMIPLNQYLENTQKTWVIIQIEHIDAVRNLDEILKVEGVDAFIIGMSDLSASVGLLGQIDSPEVVSLIEEVCAKMRANNRIFGVAMAYRPDLVERWKKYGAQLIGVGGEEEFLVRAGQNAINGVRDIFSSEQTEK